jgi:large subunit ribosomal protein L6
MWAAKFCVLCGNESLTIYSLGEEYVSRIGKKIIEVPKDVNVSFDNGIVTVKGSKGELKWSFPTEITWEIQDGQLSFARHSEDKKVRALHGLTRALIASMIEGVTKGFTRSLDIEGVGYKAEMKGKNLFLSIGYSHPVLFIPPQGITISTTTATNVVVTGIDKQLVGEVAANIRKIRKPEPYKGKGIRYSGEYIRRKAGKSGGKGK